jgi:hypothetical protein
MTYLKSLGLPPYVFVDNNNRNSAFGVIVEVLAWIMTFSCIFLMGMFLNWFLYTRHERIDRVWVEENLEPVEEEEEEEVINTSLDQKAMLEYEFEKFQTFEVEGTNYYPHQDRIFELVD